MLIFHMFRGYLNKKNGPPPSSYSPMLKCSGQSIVENNWALVAILARKGAELRCKVQLWGTGRAGVPKKVGGVLSPKLIVPSFAFFCYGDGTWVLMQILGMHPAPTCTCTFQPVPRTCSPSSTKQKQAIWAMYLNIEVPPEPSQSFKAGLLSSDNFG